MEEQKPTPLLSLKEIRVINLAKRCLTNKEIAEQLKIKVSTVKSHRRKVMKKLGLKGKNEFLKFLVLNMPKM
ncbi:MAG: helix-turn-helix transcriptional regulator [Bacteroidia bacterium]|nr:helix-turn-helix transcriptional regulator [Bacteroidia bacterium]